MTTRWGAAALLLALGCGGSTNDEGSGGGGAAGSGGGSGSGQGGGGASGAAGASGSAGASGAAGPGCPESGACQSKTCDNFSSETGCGWECSLSMPCPAVDLSGPDTWSLSQPWDIDNPSAVACVFAALRDGTEGSYVVRRNAPHPFSQSDTYDVRAGRVVLHSRSRQMDLGADWSHDGPHALKPASFFESCMAVSSTAAQVQCLDELFDGC